MAENKWTIGEEIDGDPFSASSTPAPQAGWTTGEELDYDPFGTNTPGRTSGYLREFAQGAGEIAASIPEGLDIATRSALAGAQDAPKRAANLARERISLLQEGRDAAVREGRNPESFDRQIAFYRENLVAAEGVDPADWTLPNAADMGGFDLGKSIRSAIPQSVPQYRDEFGGKVAQGFGSAAAFILGSIATGGSGAGAALLGAASSASQLYREAKKEGASEQDALLAGRLAGAVGVSEAIPVISWLRRRGGEGWSAFVQKVAKDATEEGLQEGIQGTLQNLIAQNIYDPDRGTFENVPESMLVGAIVGGGIGAGVASLESRASRDAPPAPPKEVSPTLSGRNRARRGASAEPSGPVIDIPEAGLLLAAGYEPTEIMDMTPEIRAAAAADASNSGLAPLYHVLARQRMSAAMVRPGSQNLTDSDRNSPIPNETIEAGKQAMNNLLALPAPQINIPAREGQIALGPDGRPMGDLRPDERMPAAARSDMRRPDREPNLFNPDDPLNPTTAPGRGNVFLPDLGLNLGARAIDTGNLMNPNLQPIAENDGGGNVFLPNLGLPPGDGNLFDTSGIVPDGGENLFRTSDGGGQPPAPPAPAPTAPVAPTSENLFDTAGSAPDGEGNLFLAGEDSGQLPAPVRAPAPAPSVEPALPTPPPAAPPVSDIAPTPAPRVPKAPITSWLKGIGGVDPNGVAGRELVAMGVTAKRFPGLFKKGGASDLDNIVASEHPEMADRLQSIPNEQPEGGYFDRQDVLDAIADEANGRARLNPSEQEAVSRYGQQFKAAKFDQDPVDPVDTEANLRISHPDDDFLTSSERRISIKAAVDSVLEASDLASVLSPDERGAVINDLEQNGGHIENAIEWRILQDIEYGESTTPEEFQPAPFFPAEGDAGARPESAGGEGQDPGAAQEAGQGDRGPQAARSGTEEGGSIDLTPEGAQMVIPGAEQITDRQRAERQQGKPMRGKNAPLPEDGIFGSSQKQADIFDTKPAEPEQAAAAPAERPAPPAAAPITDPSSSEAADRWKGMDAGDRMKAVLDAGLDPQKIKPARGWQLLPLSARFKILDAMAGDQQEGDAIAPARGDEAAPKPNAAPKPKRTKASAPERAPSPEFDTDPDAPALTAKPDKIEDFGEKIIGARKDYAQKMVDAKAADLASSPLSVSWPDPDYQKLIDSGIPSENVGLMRAMREQIPARPRTEYKLKGWVAAVDQLRGIASDLMDGSISAEEARKKIEATRGGGAVTGRADLYAAVGHGQSLKGVNLTSGSYGMKNGVTYSPNRTFWVVTRDVKATAFSNVGRELASGDTKEEAIANFKKAISQIETQPPAAKQMRFSVYSGPALRKTDKPYAVGIKIGKTVLNLETFPDVASARKRIAEGYDELVEKVTQAKAIPNERNAENRPRVGGDHRGGEDVTPEMFVDAFGFRGVQFGNYVEGSRRQEDLNRAYDALMDLAAVLDLPSRAMSLNGELGLAFGARGKGGKGAAAAHYEPAQVVINLTKTSGAGSLAHEWWHALDNYFPRKDGAATNYATREGAPGLRSEVAQAFKAVKTAIMTSLIPTRSKRLDERRSSPYWSTMLEMTARSFESFIIAKLQDQSLSNDYLANVVDQRSWDAMDILGSLGGASRDTYPYPTQEEMPAIRVAYDGLLSAIEHREGEGGRVELYQAPFGWSSIEPEAIAVTDGMLSDLRARLDNLGLRRVDLVSNPGYQTSTSQGSGGKTMRPAGAYVRKGSNQPLIVLANSTDPAGTLDHEAIHAARDAGLFTEKEWTVLSGRAKALWIKKFDIKGRYPEGDQALWEEEGIAEGFRLWAEGNRNGFSPEVHTAFQKMQRLIEAIRNWMAGNGFQTADDILKRFDRGDMGTSRGVGRPFAGARIETGTWDGRSDKIMEQRPPRTDTRDVDGFMAVGGRESGLPRGVSGFLSGLRAAPAAAAKQWARDFDQAVSNQFSPVRAMELRVTGVSKLPIGMDSAFKSLEIAVNDAGRVEVLLHHGAASYDENGAFMPKAGTIGLVPMMQKLGGGQAVLDWMHWMAARRADDLEARGIATPLTESEITEGLDKETDLFRVVAADWKAFNDANLDFAVESGLVHPNAAEAMKEDETYIPFYRADESLGDDLDPAIKGPIYSRSRGVNNPKSGIRAIKGGRELRLNNLVENMILNSKVIVAGSMRNMAAQKTSELLEMSGEATIYGPGEAPTGGVEKGVITFRRDGIITKMRPEDPAMALALAGLKPQQLNGILSFMASVAAVFRQGITLSPAFIIRNLIRGSVSTAVLTGANITLRHNTITGLAKALGNTEEAIAFKARSGMGDFKLGGTDVGFGRNDILIDIGLAPRSAGWGLRKLVAGMEYVGTATELADRIALQENMINNHGMRPDEAAYQALNIINYGRRGSSQALQTMLPLIPFLNARIQGLARMLEASSGERDLRQGLGKIALRGAVLSAATAALWAWNQDDDERRKRYEDEPLYRRLNYHIFYSENGTAYLIPKAFEIAAIFSTLPEVLLNAGVKGDTKELTPALMQTLVSTFSFNPVPAAVLPALEIAANYNFFTGRPIEGGVMEDRLRIDRRDGRTTQAAVAVADTWLASALKMSPVQIQHLIDGYGGVYANFLGSSVEIAGEAMGVIPSRPEGAFGTFPGSRVVEAALGSMVKPADMDASNRYLGEFYDLRDEVTQIMRSARDAAGAGEAQRANDLVSRFPGAPGVYKALNKTGAKMSDLNGEMRRIYRDSQMSAAEKRAALTPLVRTRKELTETVVKAIREVEEQQGRAFDTAE